MKIPIHVTDGNFKWHCHIEITPEIRAQIMGDLPGRVAKLEAMCSEFAGYIQDGLNFDAPADKPAPAVGNGAGCVMTRKGQPGLLPDCEADFQKHLAAEKDQPAGDDAAGEALAYAQLMEANPDFQGKPTRGDWKYSPYIERAKHILAAIRRGEVPGLYDEAAVKQEQAAMYAAGMRDGVATAGTSEQIADLRAKLAAEYDARCRIQTEMKAERGKALERVAELEQIAHVNTGARCAALERTLAAMTERAERAERLADSLANTGGR